MKYNSLKLSICVLISLALFFGLDLPRFLLPDWSPLARSALDAAGQLLAYTAMAGLALWAAPLLDETDDRSSRP